MMPTTPQGGPVLDLPGDDVGLRGLACPPPAIVDVEERGFVLEHAKPRGLRYAAIIGPLVVHRKNSVLVEGVDYAVDRVRGVLAALQGGARTKVDVIYRAAGERVDFVVGDGAGRFEVRRGREVPRVAHAFEPAPDERWRRLFRIYRTAAHCHIQPVHLFDGFVRLDRAAEYAAAIRRSRDRLQGWVRDRLQPGAQVRWGFYGDSTSALGVTHDPALNRQPNVHRDLVHFFKNYDAAARAGVPHCTFGELHPGAGDDTYGRQHVKASAHWHLTEWIGRAFGARIEVRNWAIGATHTGPGVQPSGLMNMSHPQRLGAILADRLDIVNLCVGPNDVGKTATYDNVMQLGAAFRERGTEVLLFAPMRPHPLARRIDAWREACDTTERAARDLGCACVQTALAFDDAALAGWFAPDELAAADGFHHPGFREFDVAGRLAIDLFRQDGLPGV